MTSVSTGEITRASIASFSHTPDPRLRQISEALVRHLHAFVVEVQPAQEEWEAAIGFLTRVGHTCQGARQEFILLSDVLGVSMLVDEINAPEDDGATESTVLGPFFVDNPPRAAQGADLAAGVEGGEPLSIEVQVTDVGGSPLPGAQVDIWQCAADGLYDVQRDLPQGEHELRGRFQAGSDGRVRCRSIVPVPYQIPADGPVGDLLAATGRHPWRPAHVHFRISARGYTTLTTHLFPQGDPYLKSDAVFAVKQSLVVEMPARRAGQPHHAGRRLEYVFKLESSG